MRSIDRSSAALRLAEPLDDRVELVVVEAVAQLIVVEAIVDLGDLGPSASKLSVSGRCSAREPIAS